MFPLNPLPSLAPSRLPRFYRYAVRYLIASAAMTDTFILGARSGRLLQFAATHPEWQPFAWFGSITVFVVNMLAVYFVLLLVQVNPFPRAHAGCHDPNFSARVQAGPSEARAAPLHTRSEMREATG